MERKYCNIYKTVFCDITEELFYPVFSLLYRGIHFLQCNWSYLLYGDVVIFGSLDVVMFDLQLLCRDDVLRFGYGLAGSGYRESVTVYT